MHSLFWTSLWKIIWDFGKIYKCLRNSLEFFLLVKTTTVTQKPIFGSTCLRCFLECIFCISCRDTLLNVELLTEVTCHILSLLNCNFVETYWSLLNGLYDKSVKLPNFTLSILATVCISSIQHIRRLLLIASIWNLPHCL